MGCTRYFGNKFTGSKIKALRDVRVTGKSLIAGKTYAVPGDVSIEDATELIILGKAVEAAATKTAKPPVDKMVKQTPAKKGAK